jgi:hypothetical protein
VSPALEALGRLLREQGGLLASLLPDEAAPLPDGDTLPVGATPPGGPPATARERNGDGSEPARIAAAGPRTHGHAADYELLVEAIYEGYLLHYGAPRLLHPPEADLGLLAGDQLYAFGLARLVGLGDLEAVAELADVITLTALAQGAGHDELSQEIWAAGARAVGWGSSEHHRRAKALARVGDAGALAEMRAAAEGP